MGLHGAVRVHGRHVHVVDEVDELLGPRGTVVGPGLLLQGFLHDLLEHERSGVVVERDGRDQSILS